VDSDDYEPNYGSRLREALEAAAGSRFVHLSELECFSPEVRSLLAVDITAGYAVE
jgi:hypothetical protein